MKAQLAARPTARAGGSGETPSSTAAAIASGTIMFDDAVFEHASVKNTVKTMSAAVSPHNEVMPVTPREPLTDRRGQSRLETSARQARALHQKGESAPNRCAPRRAMGGPACLHGSRRGSETSGAAARIATAPMGRARATSSALGRADCPHDAGHGPSNDRQSKAECRHSFAARPRRRDQGHAGLYRWAAGARASVGQTR